MDVSRVLAARDAAAARRALDASGLLLDEDWLAWTREVAFYRATPDALDVVDDLATLRRVLTALARQDDALVDGAFAAAWRDGFVARVLLRVADLARD